MKNTTKNNLIAELEMLGNEIEDKNIDYAVMHGGLHNLTIKELREEIECAKNALKTGKKRPVYDKEEGDRISAFIDTLLMMHNN